LNREKEKVKEQQSVLPEEILQPRLLDVMSRMTHVLAHFAHATRFLQTTGLAAVHHLLVKVRTREDKRAALVRDSRFHLV
jgi:hypothetical protein